MAEEKEKGLSEISGDSPEEWNQKIKMQKQGSRLYDQIIYRDWCKACGICITFCPTTVYDRDEGGKPLPARPDDCIGCRFCEWHCPDFAITIEERHPDRRKEDR